MSEKDYKEILWLSKFDETGYGIWARRNVEVIQSSNDFLLGISSYHRLPPTDSISILQEINLEKPYIVHNFIPNYTLKEGEGFCTCSELREPPQDQIYNLNKAEFVLTLGNWCTKVYKDCLDEPEKVFPVNFPLPKQYYRVNGPTVKFDIPDHYKFKFLFVGRIDIRKNIDTLIRAFKEEFGNNNEVCLLLKLSGEEYTCVPKWLMDQKLTKNIFWVPDRVENIADLLRSVNAYICTDFGEGWGAPCTEAMLCGVPTIMPNHSGHLNYGNKFNSWLIDVNDWEYIGYGKTNYYPHLLPPSSMVKYPKEDSIRANMAKVYEQFKDAKREEYQHHVKIQEALKIETIVSYRYILEQFKTAFKWISEN